MKIKAVIYDVDGTLVNSEPLHVAAWNKALSRYGHSLQDLSGDFVRTMAGKKPIVIAQDMVSILRAGVTPEEFLETKTQYYLDLVKTDLRPMEGAVESVKSLNRAGVRLGIGTSLDSGLLKKILRNLSIESYFEQIVTGDMISKGKPDPETYLKVMKKLDLSGDECVVIEDAQSGILSAKAADAWCIALENQDQDAI